MDVAAGEEAQRRVAVVVIHGVGETDTGWINDYIVDPLEAPQQTIEIVEHSELYRLPGRKADPERFTALVRRASSEGRRITFIEVIWSDLSRIASGPITYMMATLKLMFEAPDVLARAFLRKRWRGLHALIGALVLASSRLLGWFIVGLNLVILACAMFMTTVWLLKSAQFLPSWLSYDDRTVALWLAPVLVALLIGGMWISARARDDDIGLAEFGRGLALSAAAVMIYVALKTAAAHLGIGVPEHWPDVIGQFAQLWESKGDFDKGRLAVFAFWLAWCVTTLAAMGLLILLECSRAIGRAAGWRPADPIPLAATWAAIFNILVQAIMVKLIITPASILACTQLRSAYVAAVPDTPLTPMQICDVDVAAGIFFFTLVESVLVLAALIAVLVLRRSAVARDKASGVPRLIVHPLLIAAAVASVVFHIVVFAEELSRLNLLGLGEATGYNRVDDWVRALLVWLMPAYAAAGWFFHSAAAPVVQIARQLVDHQYRTPAMRLNVFARGRQDHVALNECARRKRIATRLDAVMDRLLAGDRIDKLVLLTHSQGSVIAYDYLRAPERNEALERIGEIHLVTMGSPLSHIYGFYFDEYARKAYVPDLRGNVVSWTNFWRVDDPIGTRVDVVAGHFIDNRRLGPGGHVDYWKEPDVRVRIRELLELPAAPATA